MKKIIYLFTVAIISMAASCTENSNQKKLSEITFKGDIEHDFGTIDFDGDGNYEFIFKNTGKAPLIITHVKSPCGCTVPTYPKEPIKIKKEASIKVEYDTKRAGQFNKIVTVYSNAVNSPTVLRITGFVEGKE